MIPVLSVTDPDAAIRALEQQFGFTPGKGGQMTFGAARIVVVRAQALPAGFTPFPLDHVAFTVADVDAVFGRYAGAGAVLDAGFTPEGPQDIPEFWEGMRYVFFEGPDGAPFEFCALNGPNADPQEGHAHFGVRAGDLDAAEASLAAMGAVPLARFRLPRGPGTIHVRFLQAGPAIFELFDAAPRVPALDHLGWIGFIPD